MRKLCTIFHSGCSNLHSHKHYTAFPFLHTLTINYYLYLFVNSHSNGGIRLYLFVVLICISLMISDVEHPFMLLLAICMSSLKICLFRSSAHFNWIVWAFFCCCCYLFVWVLYIFWILSPYQIYGLQTFSSIP